MSNELTTAQANLWKLADSLKIGRAYTEHTRNPDKSVRDSFKAEKEIRGSFAWGVCKCLSLPTANYTDEECAEIAEAIQK